MSIRDRENYPYVFVMNLDELLLRQKRIASIVPYESAEIRESRSTRPRDQVRGRSVRCCANDQARIIVAKCRPTRESGTQVIRASTDRETPFFVCFPTRHLMALPRHGRGGGGGGGEHQQRF